MEGRYTLSECLLTGLFTATLLGGIAATVFSLGGGAGLQEVGINLKSGFAAYFASGVLGPLIFWGLQGAAESRLGASIVGALVLLPTGFAFGLLVTMPFVERVSGGLSIVLLGAAIGFSLSDGAEER